MLAGDAMMVMANIEIEIDGRKLTVNPSQTVIQAADEAGIYIPRFCYHKHLSIPANCRMCLVEMEKSPKPIPACATPVAAGMKIFTKSSKTLAAQKSVMEFLLINHPLDCPICDQGGECELQDLSMGYGSGRSDYTECKRAVPDQDLGPLIATEMTRCIYCTRCVRFGDEIAGLREIGAIGRGEFTEISTYVQHAVKSEVSGNIIDLCPVGALTSKPYRFTARPWELDQAPSIAPHDCVGSNLNIHTRYGKVMRVVARENTRTNQTWISDRDRYSYAGLYHPDRLEEPLARIDGKLVVVEWRQALEMAAAGLQETISTHGSDKVGALASPNSTLEEFYLLQKVIRGLGSPHVDHRLREIDTRDQADMGQFLGLPIPIDALEECDAILLVGSNIQKEQPMLGVRVRKASLNGAAVIAINPMDYQFNFAVSGKKIIDPHFMVNTLAGLAKALNATDVLDHVVVDEETKQLAHQLKGKQKICIVLGALALHHPKAATLRYLAQQIAKVTGAKLGLLTDGANSAGGWLAGAIPHRHTNGSVCNNLGLSAYEMVEKARKAYLLMNVEPELDFANSYHAVEALKQATCVVALSAYRNSVLEQHAQVILPMAPFTETSGTFINVTGEWQSFTKVAKNFGQSRPAWKILRVLGNFLQLSGFSFDSAEEVLNEVKAVVSPDAETVMNLSKPRDFELASEKQSLTRIGEIPIYSLDSLVRRSQPLQATQEIMEGDTKALRLHPETAKHLGLKEGAMAEISQRSVKLRLPVLYDTRVAQQAVWVAGGIAETAGLGDLIGQIEVDSVKSTA
jgi:NADH-quinone oxidoreductase subunit G